MQEPAWRCMGPGQVPLGPFRFSPGRERWLPLREWISELRCSDRSILHSRPDLAGELEQALLDQRRNLAGDGEGLLPLREHANVPVVAVLSDGQRGARLLVGLGLLPELADRLALPLDLLRPRLLAFLKS